MSLECEVSVNVWSFFAPSEAANDIPALFHDRPCTYQIWHKENPQYVGYTTQIQKRVRSHIQRDRLGNRFRTEHPWVFKIKQHGSECAAKNEERRLINSGRFPLNGNLDVSAEIDFMPMSEESFARLIDVVDKIGFKESFALLCRYGLKDLWEAQNPPKYPEGPIDITSEHTGFLVAYKIIQRLKKINNPATDGE